METRNASGAPVYGLSSMESQPSRSHQTKHEASARTPPAVTTLVFSAENRPDDLVIKPKVFVEDKSNENNRPKQASMATSGSVTALAESPRVPKMVKSGLNFVIPKNKLLGSMVPVNRSATKCDPLETKKEELKLPARKTKWGPDLTQDAAVKRGRALALQTRVEQLVAQLESGNLDIDNNDDTRSPSPPPLFDMLGHRVNTREVRKREQLDIERREAIGECMKLNSAYDAPSGYKPVAKEAKLYIPAKEHPGYNFVGLILGPRGNIQRRMEAETGAKITIRGKGAVKEGKMQSVSNVKEMDNALEELHVHISAECFEKVDAAVALIEPLLTPVDEDINMHKMNQLRELVEMNGTLNDCTKDCSLCREAGHTEWQCPKGKVQYFQENVLCNICGDGGHPTMNCPRRNSEQGAMLNKDYLNFVEHHGAALEAAGTSLIRNQTFGPNISQPMLLTTLGAHRIPARWMAPPANAGPSGIPILRGPLIGVGDAGVVARFSAPISQGMNPVNPFVPRFYQTSAPNRGQLFPGASMPVMTSMLPAFRGQSPGATGLPSSVPVTNVGRPLSTTISTMPSHFQASGPAVSGSPSLPRGSQSVHTNDNNMNGIGIVVRTSAAPFAAQGMLDPNSQHQASTSGSANFFTVATSGPSFSSSSAPNMVPVGNARPVLQSGSVHTISLSPAVVPSLRPVTPSIRPALSGSVVQHNPNRPLQHLSNAIRPNGGLENAALPPSSNFPRPLQAVSGSTAFWSHPLSKQVVPSLDRPPAVAITPLPQPFASSNSQPLPSPIRASSAVPMAPPPNVRAPTPNLPPVSSTFTAVPPPSQFMISPNNSLVMSPGQASLRPGFPSFLGSETRANNPLDTPLTRPIQQMSIPQQNVFRPWESPISQNTQFTQGTHLLQRAEVPSLGAQGRPEFRSSGMLQNQQGILVRPPSILGNASLSRPLGPHEAFTPNLHSPQNPIPNFTGGVASSTVSSEPFRNQPDFQQINGQPAMAAIRSWGPNPPMKPQTPRPQIQEVDPEYEKLMASVGVL